jgi:hypothetical protein
LLAAAANLGHRGRAASEFTATPRHPSSICCEFWPCPGTPAKKYDGESLRPRSKPIGLTRPFLAFRLRVIKNRGCKMRNFFFLFFFQKDDHHDRTYFVCGTLHAAAYMRGREPQCRHRGSRQTENSHGDSQKPDTTSILYRDMRGSKDHAPQP